MRNLLIVAIAALLVAAFVLLTPSRSLGPYQRPNILIISVDTLRPDHLGAYGYAKPTSPAIDALAQRAITFDMAFAPRGMTWPSLATMLTSLTPTTTNVRWNGQYLPDGVPTLASIVAKSGYETSAFLGGSICHLAKATGHFGTVECGEDQDLARSAVEHLGQAKDGPFFSWVHLMATHAPYAPPAQHDVFTSRDYKGPVARERLWLDSLVRQQTALSPADLAELHGLYDGEVRTADAHVAEVLAALDERGLRDDTIIVLTADHGEDLYQHNRYLYHACSIYDSSLRIPLLLALPDGAEAGRRYAPIVEMADLAPTLLELAGLEPLPSFEGSSLLGRLERGDDASAAREDGPIALSEWYDPNLKKSLKTVRTARWRYISNPEGLTPVCQPSGDYYKVAREELYDHSVDPAESRNVAAEHPKVAEWLSGIIRAGHQKADDDAPLPVDPNLTEELRSLGYVE